MHMSVTDHPMRRSAVKYFLGKDPKCLRAVSGKRCSRLVSRLLPSDAKRCGGPLDDLPPESPASPCRSPPSWGVDPPGPGPAGSRFLPAASLCTLMTPFHKFLTSLNCHVAASVWPLAGMFTLDTLMRTRVSSFECAVYFCVPV